MILKPFYIGDIKIDPPIVLAPMAGVTDLPFRELVAKFGGVGLMVSEMIASRAIIQKTKKAIRKTVGSEECNEYSSSSDNKRIPLAIQIAGCDPRYMAEAAKLNEDLGAEIIDINFGCPVKKVVKGFAGSAIMKDEKLAKDIIHAVVGAVKVPVTVKMRMGWDMNNLNAQTIAKIAEAEGVRMVTVHGRTRSQMYEGKANWEFISKVKEVLTIPVVANGDIKTPEDAKECLKQSKADGIMIGRGIYGKPWLLKQIYEYLSTGSIVTNPSHDEIGKITLKHFDAIIKYYGDKTGVNLAKKHIGWYSSGMKNSGEFRNRINRMESTKEIRSEIKKFWEKLEEVEN